MCHHLVVTCTGGATLIPSSPEMKPALAALGSATVAVLSLYPAERHFLPYIHVHNYNTQKQKQGYTCTCIKVINFHAAINEQFNPYSCRSSGLPAQMNEQSVDNDTLTACGLTSPRALIVSMHAILTFTAVSL